MVFDKGMVTHLIGHPLSCNSFFHIVYNIENMVWLFFITPLLTPGIKYMTLSVEGQLVGTTPSRSSSSTAGLSRL
jgi:hypothetical protein